MDILREKPNFIESIWNNDEYRTHWFTKGEKEFTKINYNDKVFLEKTGTSFRELKKYERLDEMIRDNGWKPIRAAEIYFGNKNKILLEYCPIQYDLQMEHNNAISPNSNALDELWDIEMSGILMDFCIERGGDLIVIGPHM